MTKKGAFPSENALLKVLYLHVLELQYKWKSGTIRNLSMVLNQLLINDKISEQLRKYANLKNILKITYTLNFTIPALLKIEKSNSFDLIKVIDDNLK